MAFVLRAVVTTSWRTSTPCGSGRRRFGHPGRAHRTAGSLVLRLAGARRRSRFAGGGRCAANGAEARTPDSCRRPRREMASVPHAVAGIHALSLSVYVSSDQWRQAVERPNADQMPPEPHLLLRDQPLRYAASCRNDRRKAVIDAATAVEIALASRRSEQRWSEHPTVASIDRVLKNRESRSPSYMTSPLRSASMRVVSGNEVRGRLAGRRNDAVHEGTEPGAAQTGRSADGGRDRHGDMPAPSTSANMQCARRAARDLGGVLLDGRASASRRHPASSCDTGAAPARSGDRQQTQAVGWHGSPQRLASSRLAETSPTGRPHQLGIPIDPLSGSTSS